MSAVLELIDQIDGSLQSSSSSQRLQMLRSVTDLYLGGAETHSEENTELFDQVLNKLIDYVETQALARLSAELAPIDTAPLRAVQRLARHDDIEVSAPLLRESKRLDGADLVEIASTKSQAHLAVIGGRYQLDESVTDVLVTRGDTEVAKIVAANEGARFSEIGFSTLVTRASQEVGLGELVAVRQEMTGHHFKALLVQATDKVRRRLMSISDPRAHAKITKVTTQIAREVERAVAPAERDYSSAKHLVESMRQDPALLRLRLLEFAAAQRFEETVVSLAVLGELSLSVVEKLIAKNDDGGVLVLCKGIGLDWPTTGAILSLCAAGGRVIAADDLRSRFEKLNDSTTRRVLRFWQVRTSVAAPAAG